MANIYCIGDVSFSIDEDEKEILQKAYNIIEKIRYVWFIKDDNAWDNENYWEIENAVKMLERLFKCKKRSNLN